MTEDNEANRLSARATRYARLGVNAGAFAAKVGVNRLRGGGRETDARRSFGSRLDEGPADEGGADADHHPRRGSGGVRSGIGKLQSQAPPMGASFVRRRMQAGLGSNWREHFAEFDFKPAAAASLGQVHRAVSLAGEPLACKLQYPDMASAVETDLSNLDLLFSLHRRASAAIDTREMAREIRERVREELDTSVRRRSPGSIASCSQTARSCACRGSTGACRRGACSRWNGSTASRSPPSRLRRRRRVTRSPSACSTHGGARSCAMASFTAIPISAITRSPRLDGAASPASKASTCSTMAACGSSRRASCLAWSSFIAR